MIQATAPQSFSQEFEYAPPGVDVARVSLSLAYTTLVIAHNALTAPLVRRPARGGRRPPLAPQRYQAPLWSLEVARPSAGERLPRLSMVVSRLSRGQIP